MQLAATLIAALLAAWVWSTNATRVSSVAALTAGTLIAVPCVGPADPRRPRFRLSALGETPACDGLSNVAVRIPSGTSVASAIGGRSSALLVLLCGLRTLQECKGRRGHYPTTHWLGREVIARPTQWLEPHGIPAAFRQLKGSSAAG